MDPDPQEIIENIQSVMTRLKDGEENDYLTNLLEKLLDVNKQITTSRLHMDPNIINNQGHAKKTDPLEKVFETAAFVMSLDAQTSFLQAETKNLKQLKEQITTYKVSADFCLTNARQNRNPS